MSGYASILLRYATFGPALRWFGPLKLFMGMTISAEQSADNWYLDLYNGDYNEDGDKKSELVEIDAPQFGVRTINYGGSSFLMGLSYGL